MYVLVLSHHPLLWLSRCQMMPDEATPAPVLGFPRCDKEARSYVPTSLQPHHFLSTCSARTPPTPSISLSFLQDVAETLKHQKGDPWRGRTWKEQRGQWYPVWRTLGKSLGGPEIQAALCGVRHIFPFEVLGQRQGSLAAGWQYQVRMDSVPWLQGSAPCGTLESIWLGMCRCGSCLNSLLAQVLPSMLVPHIYRRGGAS